jgi:acetyl-CoA carboxylase carboxyltransferase component
MEELKDQSNQGWLPEVEELILRKRLATQMGGPDNLAKYRAAGKLNCRERIDKLLDPESFHETGATTGIPTFENGRLAALQPSNYIFGTGRINGRKVVVGADDFTIRGGAADAKIGNKGAYSERMALEFRLPMIRLVDGTGGGGSVKFLETMDRTYVPANPALDLMEQLLSTVPVVAGAMGSVAGLGAARVVISHFSVMP